MRVGFSNFICWMIRSNSAGCSPGGTGKPSCASASDPTRMMEKTNARKVFKEGMTPLYDGNFSSGWRRMGPGRSGRAYSRVCGAATAKGSEHVRVMRRQDPRLSEHLLHCRLQLLQSCHHVRAEVHTERAAVALAEAEEVAERLRRF